MEAAKRHIRSVCMVFSRGVFERDVGQHDYLKSPEEQSRNAVNRKKML
jgi:hypothetical protein